MHRLPAVSPSEISQLALCSAVFLPGDPARTGRLAFWRPDGAAPPAAVSGTVEELTVALPGASGDIEPVEVPALVLPLREALAVLTR
ncbi:hypothetical protein P8605_43560, partial [Streptomyces sp. T-3]|nr:hypothetical protein [Streptomyces sp. T-3]